MDDERKTGMSDTGSAPRVLPAFALFLIVLMTYLSTLHAGFVWDDDTTLLRNVITRPGGLWRTWFSTAQPNYWPVTWSLLWLQWQAWGANAFGYHAVNLILHALCATALWRVLVRLRAPGAWVAAAIFAVHPANVEAAAWITQQKTILSVLFAAIAFHLYLRQREHPRPATYALAMLAFTLSLLSKSATVCLPIVLLLFEWWRQARLTWRDIRRVAPFLGLSLAAGLTEIWFQYHRALAADVRSDPFLHRALVAAHAAVFYLGQAVFPLHGGLVHPTPVIRLGDGIAWIVPALWLTLAALLLWQWRRPWCRHVLLVLGAYVAMLLPVLGFLNIYFMQYAWVADHWQYPAILAPLAGAVALLHRVCTRAGHGNCAAMGRPLAILVIGVLACVSSLRARAFHDQESLFRDALVENPEAWMALSNLGTLLTGRGDFREAEALLRRAVALRPDAYPCTLSLAHALEQQGRLSAAAQCLEAARAYAPSNAFVLYEIGRLDMRTGAVSVAASCFAEAARAPRYADPHVGLALLAMREARTADAAGELRRALAIDPDQAEAQHLYGNLLFGQQAYAEARRHYEAALALDPRRPELRNDLGIACVMLGDLPSAIGHFRAALEANPADAGARENLARALRSQAAGDAPHGTRHPRP